MIAVALATGLLGDGLRWGGLLAAAPYEDFARRNTPTMIAVALIIAALLVVRLVYRTLTRTILLAILTLIATFVLVERDNIQECAETCECSIAGVDATVPRCDRS